jgi:hypothetical protein
MKFKALDWHFDFYLRLLIVSIFPLVFWLLNMHYGSEPDRYEIKNWLLLSALGVLISLILLSTVRLRVTKVGITKEYVLFGIKLFSKQEVEFDKVFITISEKRLGFTKHPFAGWENSEFQLVCSPIVLILFGWRTKMEMKGNFFPKYHVIRYRRFIQEIFNKAEVVRTGQNSVLAAHKIGIMIPGNVKFSD